MVQTKVPAAFTLPFASLSLSLTPFLVSFSVALLPPLLSIPFSPTLSLRGLFSNRLSNPLTNFPKASFSQLPCRHYPPPATGEESDISSKHWGILYSQRVATQIASVLLYTNKTFPFITVWNWNEKRAERTRPFRHFKGNTRASNYPFQVLWVPWEATLSLQ